MRKYPVLIVQETYTKPENKDFMIRPKGNVESKQTSKTKYEDGILQAGDDNIEHGCECFPTIGDILVDHDACEPDEHSPRQKQDTVQRT